MKQAQFRVLYRQFLFRMVDLEVLSASALGDTNKLLGQFAALLVFLSIWMSLGAFGFASSRMAPQAALLFTLVAEHFLVATTMLVIGLFAVLSWDSTFPNRRDVMVLSPLPVRGRTMFLAKVAAVATSLGLTIALLHGAMGLVWPMAFEAQAVGQEAPAMTFEATTSPVQAAELQSVLNRDLPAAVADGPGLTIGVVTHGDRRIFSYGKAQPDARLEAGSLTKTFTALILARMADQGHLRLSEPVRLLLPAGTARRPIGKEIRLVDLATHHAGLPGNGSAADLTRYLTRYGVAAPPEPAYHFSNLGFLLLSQALEERAGATYVDLLQTDVAGPLGLRDTTAESGAIRSTAADLLTYLDCNLHPEKAGALAGAIRETQKLRAEGAGDSRVGLAWLHRGDSDTYFQNSSTREFSSFAFFNPTKDFAALIFLNQSPELPASMILLDDHIRQRLAGQPAVSLKMTYIPASKGFTGLLRWYGAYWFTMLASALFIYCGVLTVQGAAAQLLPRRLFLRVSGLLQMAAFCLFLFVYFLQPLFGSMESLDSPETRAQLLWLPSYWFLGLFHQLNGSMYAPLAPLAHRAWVGLAVVVCGTAVAYTLSYVRTLRQIVEEPDITPGLRTVNWLPPFGNRVQTAIGQFAVRSLMRSRQHRVILAFYLGIGFALMTFLLKAPTMRTDADAPLLAASVVMLAMAMIGTRVVFAFPLDLRANWIFQVVGLDAGAACLTATRRALLLLSAAPVWIVTAVVCFRAWPWQQAAGHLILLALLAMILCDFCFLQFRKIPFACSYLPGKSQVHMVFLCAVGLLYGVMACVQFERLMLQEARSTVALLAPFALVAVGVRVVSLLMRSEDRLRFEEAPTPAVQELGLQR
ncbi:MAG TPA: serine hydrolase [Candidatus Sulfopaludibacter sp.]|jgi:CubicO group peptidase (beta-lactamase class C family)|nr:serine hydrolase [Candidatus Sulfopaludibacter sp.]